MSFAYVRTLFRERLEGLGFEEHIEPFQPNQIGETIVDNSFHLETGSILGSVANQIVHPFDFPITVRIYRRGFVDLLEAYDELHVTADEVLTDLLLPSVRIGDPVKDIISESIDIVPIDDSNDNIMVLELVFTAKLELCYTT